MGEDENKGKIIEDENEEIITVEGVTYKKLIYYCGGIKYLVILNIIMISTILA
jgi:hypothetical protein